MQPAEISDLVDLISSYGDFTAANVRLHKQTGIQLFFTDAAAFRRFPQLLLDTSLHPRTSSSRELGDFQTPTNLADQICRYLGSTGLQPRVVVEPTCGAGNFVFAALKNFPSIRLMYGVDSDQQYVERLKIALLKQALHNNTRLPDTIIHRDNVFTHRFSPEVMTSNEVLIIGNPPWITNAELSVLGSNNHAEKKNFKRAAGLSALTGKSNFDIAESVMLRMLRLFSERSGKLAMLCKNSVIRNIIDFLPQLECKISDILALKIDARKNFGVSADASLCVMRLGSSRRSLYCNVGTLQSPKKTNHSFGWVGNRFVANREGYRSVERLDGASPFTWRQGIKHDCAKIMELAVYNERNINGLGEAVSIEDDRVYWLLKGSDLRVFKIERATKRLIITNRKLNEDTVQLERDSPRLWKYLTKNQAFFKKRKSSIYKNKPVFSSFGIGNYSFAPYKVAISGLHKTPLFALVTPLDRRSVMLDDTSYFLGFEKYEDALFTASVLNTPLIKQFLESIVFVDAKRPYTKEQLMRIDLANAVKLISFSDLKQVWKNHECSFEDAPSYSDYHRYKQRILRGKQDQIAVE
ncbi:MAG TPA: hypothetical protein VIV66_12000 [Pyrinomonadaceae bacterium]